MRCQTLQVRVLHETTTFGAQIVLAVVRQRTMVEAVRDTLSFNVLLAHASNNLRDINERTLGTRRHRSLNVVCLIQTALRLTTGLVTGCVKHNIDETFKRLNHGSARLGFKFSFDHAPPDRALAPWLG